MTDHRESLGESRPLGPSAGTDKADVIAPCAACAVARAAGARFCPACGARLVPAADPIKPAGPKPESPSSENAIVAPVSSPAMSDVPTAPPEVPVARSDRAPVEPVTCRCGEGIPDDARYCPACGAEIETDTGPEFVLQFSGPDGERSVPVTGPRLVIGKDADCDIAVVTDDFLSRQHAQLTVTDGEVVLADLGSSNGTFVKTRGPISLDAGDEFLAGACRFHLERPNGQTP